MKWYVHVLLASALLLAVPGIASAQDPAADGIASVRASRSVSASARTFCEDHLRRLELMQRHELSATAVVSLDVYAESRWLYWPYGVPTLVQGLVQNPPASGVNLTAVVVTVRWEDASHGLVRERTVFADCWILPPGYVASFTVPDPMEPFDHYHVSSEGIDTGASRVELTSYSEFVEYDVYDRRWKIRLTNNNAFTVVGAGAAMWEEYTLAPGPTTFWDALVLEDYYQTRLAPGEWVEFHVWGLRALPPASPVCQVLAEALPAPATSPVYRFFNKRTGTHFYTIDPGERDNVIANLAWLYNCEGPAYNAYGSDYASEMPLYRFYNRRTGTHFYTADPVERDNVMASLGWLYDYEGEAYFICDSGGLATNAMYRFYNRATGTHFYTADPIERDNVIANLAWLYSYEGPAFNVPK